MLPALALAGAMALPTAPAQAWDRGGAIAAGAIGGLAVGALIGAAASNAYAYPSYGYGHGYPAYGYRFAPARAYADRPAYTYAPVVRRRVVYTEPSYRVVRRAPVVAYDPAPYHWGPTVRVGYGYGWGYGYRHAGWRW